MPLGIGGKKTIEEVVPIRDVDPITCKEKLKGDVNEQGVCLVRIEVDTKNPDEAKLLRLKYMGRGAVGIPSRLPPREEI